jgi:hypothetical protein
MGKKKKKSWKKINPEKSNKMIIAVAIGFFLLLVLGLLLVILNSESGGVTPENKGKVMEDTLKYVKRNQGVSQVKCYPEANKVVIVYESYKAGKEDFPKIARYAGLKLSNKMSHETLTVILAKDKEEHAIRSFLIRGGRVIKEKIITP